MARRLNAAAAEEAGRNDLTDEEKTALFNQAVDAELAIRRKRQEFNATIGRERNEMVVGPWKSKLGFPMGKLAEAVNSRIVKDEAEEKDDEEKLLLELEFQRIKFLALDIGTQGKFDLSGGAANMPAKKDGKAKSAANGNGKAAKSGKGRKGGKNANVPDPETVADGIDDETQDTVAEAAKKGEAAGLEGKNLDLNPYRPGSKHHQSYAAHWKTAQRKVAEGIKQTPAATAH